jgi:DNA repair ATPase RecN
MKTEQEQIEEIVKILLEATKKCFDTDCNHCDYQYEKDCNQYRKALALVQAGYGDVSEYKNRFEVADKVLTETREKLTKAEHDRDRYKAEIERLKAENCELTKRLGARFTCDFVRTAQKHAQIDVLKELKTRHDYAIKNMGYPWDIAQQIDELIKEVENE